jgi:hypothetical protein
MTSYVYFISNGEQVKIGKANNVKKRLSELQTGNTTKLTLLQTIKCADSKEAFELEKKLHDDYNHLRVSGEWFKFDKSMLDLDESIITPMVIKIMEEAKNDDNKLLELVNFYFRSNIEKSVKEIMTQLLYAQVLTALGEEYGEDSYVEFKTFQTLLTRSGTILKGPNNSLIQLKLDDDEYLNVATILDSVAANEIFVKSSEYVSDVSYQNSSYELKNEKVIGLLSKKTYTKFLKLIQEEFRDIEYAIKFNKESVGNKIILGSAMRTRPKPELILDDLVNIIGSKTLGTTEIRNLLSIDISTKPFTLKDIRGYLKEALALGVKRDLLTLSKQKQSRFYTLTD